MAASKIGPTWVQLNGLVNPGGVGTTVYFEYGAGQAYTDQVAVGSVPAGTTNVPVLAEVESLDCDTVYGYRVVASNAGGTVYGSRQTFSTAECLDPPLLNISTRGQVGTGDSVMIGGFIVGEDGATVLVRARGPSLAAAGVPNTLANPTLTLQSGQSVIASNDNWAGAPNAGAISATGLAPPDALESAVLLTLPAGAYTAIVQGAGGGTGVGIVEVFDSSSFTGDGGDAATAPPLVNISTRGQVGTGDDVMIGGFIVGEGGATVLVRARGPSLAAAGVPNAIANPTLMLQSGQSVIASNDNWGSAANAAAISATGLAPPNGLESAILLTLPAGAYTAIVQGVGGGIGVGIIEVFDSATFSQ
jgi:hypothetical protein